MDDWADEDEDDFLAAVATDDASLQNVENVDATADIPAEGDDLFGDNFDDLLVTSLNVAENCHHQFQEISYIYCI